MGNICSNDFLNEIQENTRMRNKNSLFTIFEEDEDIYETDSCCDKSS